MWRIIFCAVILVVCSGQPLDENPTTPEKDKEPTPLVVIQESPTPPPPPTPVTSSEPPQPIVEVTKPLQETETPAATTTTPVVLEEENDVNSNRRTVTYDQRQEGQYNIRADLENFMIVLIPPSPMDGVNLLDLLSKSSKRTKSHHKKYHQDGSKYRQSLKSGQNSHNMNFFGRHHQSQQPISHIILEEQPSARISEFIEGRTPYRVDISSSNSDLEQLQMQQQYQPQHPHGPQVDVLPPPYPLSYHHLIKPFHLEAEPTVIQTLPPQSIPSSGKFMDSNGNFFRMARAIPGGSLYGLLSLDANRVQPRQRTPFDEQLLSTLNDDDDDDDDEEEVGEGRSIDLPLSNDSLEEAIHNYVYPPLNPLRFNPGLLDLHSRSMQPNYPKYNEEDNAKTTEIELKLLGATEECGPDRKRDSYGICRFAEGY